MRLLRSGCLVLLACALCATLMGCASPPAKVVSTWPVAAAEATVAPPADARRFPLTGQPAPGADSYPPTPICAKLVDDGSGSAPFGLGLADVVYEIAGSDSGTRLAALFQSRAPGVVGPLGSADLPDVWILQQYGAALFSIGATASVASSLERAGPLNMSRGVGAASFAYTTVRPSGGAAGTYLSGARAYRQMIQRGSQVASDSVRLRFSPASRYTTSPTNGVSIPFSATQVVGWSWEASSRLYVRSRRGQEQRDGATHARVSASNVVVMWAKYAASSPGGAGSSGFDVTLGGSGQVTVFRDGQRFDGRWKADAQSPPTFTTESGGVIRLSPGTTWFEVIPLSASITMR